jgi:hypothetical protein
MLSVDKNSTVFSVLWFTIDTLTLVRASKIKSFWNLVFGTVGQKTV